MDVKEKSEKMVRIMACSIIGISFGYLFAVTFLNLPATGQEHAKTIVGFILGVGVSTLLNYYWGSSSGSADKSAIIDEKLNGPKPEVEPGPEVP